MTNSILISVVGPTAIGKTKLAIDLAKHFNTEIISADSRQFFKEMCIGTAVPNQEELEAAPHHFIQHKSIFDTYSVGDFEKEALGLLTSLFENHKIVVMVGGSGLYVDAVTKGLDNFPKIAPEIRANLKTELDKKGISSLQEQLKSLDKTTYDKIDLANPHRVIRALEICVGTGKPYSSFLNISSPERPFKTISIGLMDEREVIYDRINKRVDIMIKDGLLEEAKKLHPNKDLNALQTVGYKELFNYFDSNWDLEFGVSEIKKNTRRFAKRQMTWFRKTKNIHWFNREESITKIIECIHKEL